MEHASPLPDHLVARYRAWQAAARARRTCARYAEAAARARTRRR